MLFNGSDEPHSRNNKTDSDCDGDDDNNDLDYDNDDSEYDDSSDNCSEDDNGDVSSNNDDDMDTLCALCDDGGNLLSCVGQCKRSFHPRKKDGRESKCKTLGYTSAQIKEIGSYLCKNCEYKQHQCFKCGELESSAEPNAKVFKCNNPTCGHFYHPKCVAKLLEPNNSDGDGSCELAKRIMAGMSFTCPIHWCSECGRMEDKTKRAMQFAVCRRCPKSYHRECLPREVSFEMKDNSIERRAWELSGVVIIYCLDHKICKSTGNAKRDHIKFPQTLTIIKLRDLPKKKGKMVGKQKSSIDQCLEESTEVLNTAMGTKTPWSAVGSNTEKRKAIGPKKETSSRTSFNIAKNKSVDHSVQISVEHNSPMQTGDMQDNMMYNPAMDKDAELESKICRTPEDKNGNGKEKSPEHLGEAEEDATNKDSSHENNEQNNVLGKLFVDTRAQVDQCKLKSRAERSIELRGNADGHDSIPAQEIEISIRENQMCPSMCEQVSRSSNGVATQDHVDDNPPKKLLHVPRVDVMIITDRLHTLQEYTCDKDRDFNGGHAFQEEPNSSQCNVNPKGTGIDTSGDMLRKRRRFKEKATQGTNTDLDNKKTCKRIENGKETHIDDSDHQCPSTHELDYQDCTFENTESNDPRCNAKNRKFDFSGYRSGERAGLSMIENLTHGTRDNSSNSPVIRNPQENKKYQSMCEHESRSGKGKIARNERSRSGSSNGVAPPGHDNENLPEKLLPVPHVDKMIIKDVLHTLAGYGCDKDREVNAGHAFQEEPNSPWCNVIPEGTGMHTSGDKARERRKFKEKAADGNDTDLDKIKRCQHIEDGKEAHIDGSYRKCPSIHEVDYQDHNFGNSESHGPRCNDENNVAEVSENKSRQSTEPSRRGNSFHSPMGRNSQEKPSNHLPSRLITNCDRYEQHLATNQHRYEQHPSTNQHRYERWRGVSNPSNDNYGPRSHVPMQPILPTTDFNANQWYGQSSNPRGPEHGWYNPGFHPGRSGNFTSGWQHPQYYPARSDNVNYSRNLNSLPIHGYDARGNFMHVGYRPMGFDPASMYGTLEVSNNGTYQPYNLWSGQPATHVNMEGRAAAYGGCNSVYGGGSNLTLASGPWGMPYNRPRG